MAALVLEVKGDFCHDIRRMFAELGRADDYIELSLDGRLTWNSLSATWLDSYSLASLLNQLFGKGKEPFWQQAYTNLVRWIIELCRVLPGGCVTLRDVYHCAIDKALFAKKIQQAQTYAADMSDTWITIAATEMKGDQITPLRGVGFQPDPADRNRFRARGAGRVLSSSVGAWQTWSMKRDVPSCRGYRFPPEIISHAVWLYHRFGVSFRDVEDLLAQRGLTVSYEAIRLWCITFGAAYARRLKRRQGRLGDTWHLDEVFVTIQGRRHYLWRAVDQDGDVIDILVQSHRDCRAATRFFRKLWKGQERQPVRLVTDKLSSYRAAHRAVMPSVAHRTDRYENNRAEVSHQPTRQRERQMRRFKSGAHAQRFLSVHGLVLNLFRVARHLLRSAHQRLLRMRAFAEWDAVTCAC